MRRMMLVLCCLMMGPAFSSAETTEKSAKENQACQENLLTMKVKAQNLDEQRDRATQEKSQLQVNLYRAQQELQAVKKELADLKTHDEHK